MPDQTKRTIDAKLAAIGREVAFVSKQSYNDYHGYAYASAEAVLSKLNEAIFGRGLALTTSIEALVSDSADEGPHNVLVKLTVSIHDPESGEVRTYQALGQGSDKGDKATMKAMTAAHKYVYALAFCISWGDDPEGDRSTDERAYGKRSGGPRKGGDKGAKAPRGGQSPVNRADAASIKSQLEGDLSPDDAKSLRLRIIGLGRDHPDYKQLLRKLKERTTDVK